MLDLWTITLQNNNSDSLYTLQDFIENAKKPYLNI